MGRLILHCFIFTIEQVVIIIIILDLSEFIDWYILGRVWHARDDLLEDDVGVFCAKMPFNKLLRVQEVVNLVDFIFRCAQLVALLMNI